jgi:hypothetical protein
MKEGRRKWKYNNIEFHNSKDIRNIRMSNQIAV